VTGHPVSGTDRPAQCPQTRVSLIFECRGLRLWHHGSAHRGVHGDTSRAIVSLPSHEVMVCETSSDGPPHVSQSWSGSGWVWISSGMASIVGGPSGASVPGHARTGLERGRILATMWIRRGGKPIEHCAGLDRRARCPTAYGPHAKLSRGGL